MSQSAELRRRFVLALWREVRVVWPILFGLVVAQWGLGFLVGRLEQWPVGDATYFTFVTGMTIGFGDLVPLRFSSRLITLAIGLIGILLTGLIAAIGVRALQAAAAYEEPR